MLNFGAPMTFDLADAQAALPKAVQEISSELDNDTALVRFILAANVDIRTFRDEAGYVVDVVNAPTDADASAAPDTAPATQPPQQDAAGQAAAANPGQSPVPSLADAAAKISAAAAVPGPAPPGNAPSPQPATIAPAAPPPKPAPPPPAAADQSPATQAATPMPTAQPRRRRQPSQRSRPRQRRQRLPRHAWRSGPPCMARRRCRRRPTPPKSRRATAHQVAAAAAAPQRWRAVPERQTTPPAAAPAPAAAPDKTSEAAPAPPAAPSAGDAAGKITAELSQQQPGGDLKLSFAFKMPVGAAVFHRADTLWIVFDSKAAIDLSALDGEPSRTIRSYEFSQSGDADIVRLKLDRPRLSSVAADGAVWTLDIGDTVLSPDARARHHPQCDRAQSIERHDRVRQRAARPPDRRSRRRR